MSHFPRCIDHLLAEEGGLVHHPSDPGGLTKFGISQRSYPALDIAHLTQAEAEALYYRDFWLPMRCDSLPAGLDLSVLDFGVNAGQQTAIRTLQRLLDVSPDGHIGPKTLAALKHSGDSNSALVNRFAQARLRFYQQLRTWKTFGRGWTRRVERIRNASLSMVIDP